MVENIDDSMQANSCSHKTRLRRLSNFTTFWEWQKWVKEKIEYWEFLNSAF